MSTNLKKYLSITTCLLFIVIGCAIKHQDSNRVDTYETGEPQKSPTHDVGLNTSDDGNLTEAGNTTDPEKDGSEHHNFDENGASNSSVYE